MKHILKITRLGKVWQWRVFAVGKDFFGRRALAFHGGGYCATRADARNDAGIYCQRFDKGGAA